MSSPSPTERKGPPSLTIARNRMKKLRSSRSALLGVIETRKSFDVESKDYMDATRIIADMIADLRSENIICECSNECVDIKTFSEDEKEEDKEDDDEKKPPQIVRRKIDFSAVESDV